MEEIRLPDLGENIDEADVVKVLVAEGDEIEKDQPLIEVETDKASFEFPSPAAGTVREVLVSEGDTVAVGAPLLRLESAEEGAGDTEDADRAPEEGTEDTEAGDRAPEDRESEPEEGEDAEAAEPEPVRTDEPDERDEPERTPPRPARAGPAARRLARELGVELAAVAAAGAGDRVTPDDVKTYVRRLVAQAPRTAPGPERPALPDFGKWGPVERRPLSRLRRTAARRLEAAWQAPHVTHHDEADIALLEKERARYEDERGDDEPKLTVTAFAVKAAASALREFPRFNCSLDPAEQELVLKRYCHVGVAVDTERGLVVPVVRDADAKGLARIAAEIGELARGARERKLQPDALRGGTFTVTNLGGIGGTSFTPVLNFPEVAILGLARARTDGSSTRLPLSLSYDHRVIDGADAARFVRHVAELLENPLQLLAGESG
jgi:pyruvate dehydrogenase E2 component (dihydrolipoamide acetyltransferase)